MSDGQVCYLLPSADHAGRLLDGDLKALPGVAFDVVGRAALIGTGIYVAGERQHVMKYALGGALAIEAFVMFWLATAKWRASLTAPGASPPLALPAGPPAIEMPGATMATATPFYP
jgi:hypothetical protein